MLSGRTSRIDSSDIHLSTKSANVSDTVSILTIDAVEKDVEQDSSLDSKSCSILSLSVSDLPAILILLLCASSDPFERHLIGGCATIRSSFAGFLFWKTPATCPLFTEMSSIILWMREDCEPPWFVFVVGWIWSPEFLVHVTIFKGIFLLIEWSDFSQLSGNPIVCERLDANDLPCPGLSRQ